MSKLQRYSSYKESGVEWIGEIPEHYIIAKLKWISKLYAGGTPNKDNLKYWENGTIPWLASGEVNQEIVTTPTTYITELGFKSSSAKWIPKDSLIVALAGQGKTKGMVAYLNIDTTGNQSLSAIIPNKNKINAKYLYYFIKAAYKELRGSAGDGQRDGLNLESLGSLITVYPPKSEQTTIVSYLDTITAQIDQAISQKEKMIELLKERRQILINNAVTKGVNSNAPMKESGVEWIGEIPEHWGIEKGKWLFKHVQRPVRPHDEIVTCFRDGIVTLRSNRRTEGFTNALKEHGYQGIRKGDFVIHNMDAFAGAIGISDSDGKSTPVYTVCRPWNEEDVSSEYYSRYLRNLALQDFILSLAKGIRERSTDFRYKDFGELLFPLPPKYEQLQIVIYIEEQTAKIDTAIELQQNYITKLKEYKATLIDSVVTGKVRVA